VRDTDAALFFGPDAVTAGRADGVSSFSVVIDHLSQQIFQPPAALSVLPSLTKEILMQETETRPAIEADTPQPVVSAPPVVVAPPVVTGPQYDQAVEIAQLCQLAGMSDKTADFLASGQSVAQVRQALLTAKAAIPAISSHADPLHNPQRTDLLMNVVKQRVGKGK
jgi:hypothetical protein